MTELINHYNNLKYNLSKIEIPADLKKANKTDMAYLVRLRKIVKQLELLFIKQGIDYKKSKLNQENIF